MKVSSNQIRNVFSHYKKRLSVIYNEQEAGSLMYIIFEHYAGFSKIDLSLNPSYRINESVLLSIHKAVELLEKKMPLQYITSTAFFYGLELYVNNHVLIPRQETEELVQWILAEEAKATHMPRVLDIGTGSGCIAIALKHKNQDFSIEALDFRDEILEVAEKNAKRHKADIRFIKFNILEMEPVSDPFTGQFDIIVSNPPYVRISEKAAMDANVVDYEPHAALFVEDKSSLQYYEAIADIAHKHLKPGGRMYFEINEALGQQLKEMLHQRGFSDILVRKDIHGRDRMIRCSLL